VFCHPPRPKAGAFCLRSAGIPPAIVAAARRHIRRRASTVKCSNALVILRRRFLAPKDLAIPARILFLAPLLATKIGLDFCSARMSRPIGRSCPPENILQVQLRTAFDQEPDYVKMSCLGSLMQRCRVRMTSDWVVSVRIFARVQQQPNNLDMTKIRRQGERQVAVLPAGVRKQPAGVLAPPQSRCHGQIHPSAAFHECLHRLKLAMQGRCVYSAVGIRSVIAQEID
jgi:hypothetical protein